MSDLSRQARRCAADHPDDLKLIERVETARRVLGVEDDYIKVEVHSDVLYETEEPSLWWCEKHGTLPLGPEGIEYV